MHDLQLLAHAKINWSLDVLSRRPDGYHDIDTIMQSITLADKVSCELADGIHITVTGDDSIPETEENLACRAALALQTESGVQLGVNIALEKHIPSAAGLGGGSADAAAVLWACNDLWDLHWPMERLQEVGVRIGADVPFCLQGGLCRATGIGERLEAGTSPHHWLVLCKPNAAVSTAAIYNALEVATLCHPDIDAIWYGLHQPLGPDWTLLDNIMMPIVAAMVPEILALRAQLLALGAWAAMMSGSGPTMFGVFEGQREARQAALAIDGIVTETISMGVETGRDDGHEFGAI